MSRVYRERKYMCGEYLEVEVYPVYAQAKGRSKKKKPTTEIQERLNRKHATGVLRRLFHTNFTDRDLFVTLTFDDDTLPETVEDGQRLVQNFLRRAKRKYTKLGLELKYIYILEYGEKHNRLHAHLVINGGIGAEEITTLWGLGMVSADKLRFKESGGLSDLAAYFTKSEKSGANRITYKRWVSSRNLEKPEISTRDGRLSHKKMRDICLDKGDLDYLEIQFCGYEMAEISPEIAEDIYGGLYLAALLKKIPPDKLYINNDLPEW